MKFNFKTLIVALLCDHQAQSGLRHDMISMIFSMWVTSPVPNYLWLVTERHDPVIARFIASFIANLLTLGEESCCVDTACNISLPWTPATSFRCYLGNVGRAIFFFGHSRNCCEKCCALKRSAFSFPDFCSTCTLLSCSLHDTVNCTMFVYILRLRP